MDSAFIAGKMKEARTVDMGIEVVWEHTLVGISVEIEVMAVFQKVIAVSSLTWKQEGPKGWVIVGDYSTAELWNLKETTDSFKNVQNFKNF